MKLPSESLCTFCLVYTRTSSSVQILLFIDLITDSWEFATSLYFEMDFIKGKKKFRWPLVRISSVAFVYNTMRYLYCRSIMSSLYHIYFLLFSMKKCDIFHKTDILLRRPIFSSLRIDRDVSVTTLSQSRRSNILIFIATVSSL